MRILLFGGGFDPPHIGHISLLKNAIEKVQPNLVLVVPTRVPPHKPTSATPAVLRAEMAECFKPVFDNLTISDIEINRQGNSYSWDTVQEIKRQYPNADLYLCIGSDMLQSFTTWHEYKKLLLAVTLVAQDRHDTDREQSRSAAKMLEEMGGKVVFTGGMVEDISSTDLRKSILEGVDVEQLIPPLALDIIRKKGLYR